jgi:hypothetical protein
MIKVGQCMNCEKIYGYTIGDTLESWYNYEDTHKCEREREAK